MSSSDDDHKLTGVSDGTPAPRVLDVNAQPLADANVSPSSDRRDHPRSGRPPRLSDRLFHTDDIQPPQPSPPYKRVASSSHLPLEYSADSPAYRSDQDLPLMPEREYVDEKANSTGHKQKPSVHYPDDVAAPTYRSRAPTLPMHDPDNPLGPSPLRKNHGRQESVATDFASDYGSDEEYDWSADEDLGEEEAKFEHRMGKKMRPKGWFRRLLAMLFGSLLGTVIVAGLLVTGPILIYKFWYQTNPTEHRRFVSDNINAWFFWAAANVLISWWLALIVDLIPSTARWLVSAFWGHVSETVKTNLELYNSVDDNIKPVTYAASGWVSWIIIFENIYELHSSDDDVPSRAPYTNRLSEVVEFLFFLALVWCIQRMASHAIAFAFHRVAFKERVSDLRNRLMVVEHLRDYRPKKRRTHNGARTPMSAFLSSGISPTAEKTFNWTTGTDRSHAASPSGTISDSEFGGDDEAASPNSKTKGKGTQNRPSVPRKSRLSKLFDSQQSRSASRGASPSGEGMSDAENDSPHRYPPSGAMTPPQRGSEDDLVVHAAKALKNAVLHDARNIQGRDATDTGLAWDVSSTSEAKRLARQIFKAFRDRRRSYLLPQDLEPAYSTPEEAQEAFRVFDEDNNGDVSREEIKRMLIKTYKERRFLSRSMRDVSNALHTLNLLLFVLAIIILFLIALPVFGVDISKSLTSFYSIAIAASFIFKSSAASMFDAVMFIFVTHPFDTGDRCFIGKENLIVKKMGLFATVFTRADGVETYYFNSQLFNMFITNCRRSDKTSETITMQMEWRTPIEKIKALEDALNDWLAHEENRWFVPSTTIVFQNFQLQRYLEVSIGISHNGNWQDWGLRNTRRTAFQAAVQHYCLQLGIRAYKPAIPVRWADPSTGIPNSPVPSAMDLPPSPMTEAQPGGGDEYAAPDMHEGALAGGQTAAGGGQTSQAQRAQAATANIAAAQKTAWLGFTPHGEGAQVRARKSKSKKPQGLDGSL